MIHTKPNWMPVVTLTMSNKNSMYWLEYEFPKHSANHEYNEIKIWKGWKEKHIIVIKLKTKSYRIIKTLKLNLIKLKENNLTMSDTVKWVVMEKWYFRVLKSPVTDQHTWCTDLAMHSFSTKMLCEIDIFKCICMCFNINKWNLITSLQIIQGFSVQWEFSVLLCIQLSWFKEIGSSSQITQARIVLNEIKYNLLEGLKAEFHFHTRAGRCESTGDLWHGSQCYAIVNLL